MKKLNSRIRVNKQWVLKNLKVISNYVNNTAMLAFYGGRYSEEKTAMEILQILENTIARIEEVRDEESRRNQTN